MPKSHFIRILTKFKSHTLSNLSLNLYNMYLLYIQSIEMLSKLCYYSNMRWYNLCCWGRRKSPQNHIETKFVGFIITQNTIIEKKKPVSAPTTHIQQFALSTRLHSNGKFVRHGKWNDWILKFVFGLFWIFVIFICCLVLLRNIHMFYNVVEKKLILHHLCSNSTPVRLCKTFGSIFRKSMNTQM